MARFSSVEGQYSANGRDSYQLFVGVFDTCLVWYLIVLLSETHAVKNITSLEAIDGNASYHSHESFSFIDQSFKLQNPQPLKLGRKYSL